MPRIRTIKPEFWTDERVVELSPWGRLLFIGLWNLCDDHGRMEYSPKRIKMQLFPADNLNVEELCAELRKNGMIHLYEVKSSLYLEVTNFAKHQQIKDGKRPSRYPPPPCADLRRQEAQNCQEGIREEEKEQGSGNIFIGGIENDAQDESDTENEKILQTWNEEKIIQHRSISSVRGLTTALESALKRHSSDEILKAIKNYSTVLTSPAHYWTHRWTLKDFLNNGLDRFVDAADPLENFKIKEKKGGKDGRIDTHFDDKDYHKGAF